MKERNVRKERKPKEGKLYRDRKMGKKGRKKENEVSKERRPRKENFAYRKDGTERKEEEDFERKGTENIAGPPKQSHRDDPN